jgi:lipopolysaccharide export system protein LptA
MGSNREPIKIDADRLDVFDREGRAVFAGNVVAVQGDTSMRCNMLTVLYEARNNAAGARAQALPSQGPGDSAIKKIDCTGPVTIVSKTQVATGDNATFDRVANRVLLVGNATLTDGPNVTQGGRVVYDLNTGIASIENPASGGRVRALFVPGSTPEAAPAANPAKPAETRPRPPATR